MPIGGGRRMKAHPARSAVFRLTQPFQRMEKQQRRKAREGSLERREEVSHQEGDRHWKEEKTDFAPMNIFQEQRAQGLDTGLIYHRQVARQGRRIGEIGSAKQRHESGGKRLDPLAKRPQGSLSAHRIANEHCDEINQFILAHPAPHKSHPRLYGFENPVSLERVSNDRHFPKPGRRARRVRRVHLNLDDRISHLPLFSFPLVSFSRSAHCCHLCSFLAVLSPSGPLGRSCRASLLKLDSETEREEPTMCLLLMPVHLACSFYLFRCSDSSGEKYA